MPRIHITGICGTFMGGLALLARQAGFEVAGSDHNIYPPMSDLLLNSGIKLYEGYRAEHLKARPDMVIIGNAMSRGNAEVEEVLNKKITYDSGPGWLKRNILKDKWVLAVSGTHGKTSTAAMLAWILEYAGMSPGFLIGGVPDNFGVSARLGTTSLFVVEADEYDTAFFDKRSKFVHYQPQTLLINNIEFDHADIFTDIDAIKRQFHHLLRTVPGNGLVVYPDDDPNARAVIDMGCWSGSETIGGVWNYKLSADDGGKFKVLCEGKEAGEVKWDLFGIHNARNALGAIACASHAGVPVKQAINALAEFKGIARRMQVRAKINGITVYDDFAHHPDAIKTTLDGLRKKLGNRRIIVILEPRSNTMKMGVLKHELSSSLADADLCYLYDNGALGWKTADVFGQNDKFSIFATTGKIINAVVELAEPGDSIIIMSNGGFEDIHTRLIRRIRERFG